MSSMPLRACRPAGRNAASTLPPAPLAAGVSPGRGRGRPTARARGTGPGRPTRASPPRHACARGAALPL
eukprot:4195876-Lingulodinium_polyedra.AAC.1